MKRICLIIIVAGLLLSGCSSLFEGSYISTIPYEQQNNQIDETLILAYNYEDLRSALTNMIRSGNKNGLIHIPQYNPETVRADMEKAVSNVMRLDPVAAYAVEDINWDLGSIGQRVIALNISYLHDRSEIRKIREVADVQVALETIYEEVSEGSTGVVLYVNDYRKTDFTQLVEGYAFDNPHKIIETPQITENIYPKSGSSRVVELRFSYQTERDELSLMKNRVTRTLSSAKGYVSDDAKERQKLFQLYSFLMERFDKYTIETSITPAYSLLENATGDSKAFATMYAALCREEELECKVVRGTRDGEAWYWNMVKENNLYYHVDLLRSNELGEFQMQTDGQMQGYVWNISAYPSCPDVIPEPTETVPENTQD